MLTILTIVKANPFEKSQGLYVRRIYIVFGLIALGVIGSLGIIAAAPTATAVLVKGQIPPTSLKAEAAPITPHRAIYTMGLASVKNGSNITDVSGRMLFEWRDVCDGWAIQQHMQLHFTYADGDDQDVVSSELTWEAKDGKAYNFNIRRTTNGQETENYRGRAIQKADSTDFVTYSVPEGKTLQLPAGTLFPTAHTELILQRASLGDKFFSRRVFDGSDESGSSDISAFISGPRALAQEASLSAQLKKNALLAEAAWPVHMAFFNIGTETGVPDYEMDLTLLPNGIARYMKIDYGDFSVNGNLEDLEALPPQKCP
jgi:hypothetical protein